DVVMLAAEDGAPSWLSADVWYPTQVESPQNERFSVILYAPGWDGTRNDNRHLYALLASRGYVVVTFDDVGADQVAERSYLRDVDQAAFDPPSLSSEAKASAFRKAATVRLSLMVRKARAVLAALAASSRKLAHAGVSRPLDLERVGMIGFSFGGSVAAEMPNQDQRFVAIANMDGWLFGAAAKSGVPTAYMAFNSDYPEAEMRARTGSSEQRRTAQWVLADRAYHRRQLRQPSAYVIFFDRVGHTDFTDALFEPSLMSYIKFWRRTQQQRYQLRASLDAFILGFFDRHLRGRPSAGEIFAKAPEYTAVRVLVSGAAAQQH
ncbi:MAG: dienelactone hydrolase family protein, partial [Hyphomicrobiaceae bacterium]|nr:dienelactone hydrolase family protein [Hyphomicrobiaceae bacterium]